ncbi:hypothetical protein [Gordonia hydrophobica]|uniref:Uncharacterized protein n=1 Tax=Gordonia hydrophobica TaxID=40516 RepID=A0ABZ2TWM4_9ACTN|nr:hypothetical protein [Gordonia hydrophobica]MBM7369290.1 hypothetical protein [Gordonia hydrophobica]
MIGGAGSSGDDVASILQLRTPQGAAVALLAWTAFVALAATSGGVQEPVVLALGFGSLGLGWALIIGSPGDPMRMIDAVTTAVSGALASALAVTAMEVTDRGGLLALGAAPAVTFALLAVRGRTALAWAGGIACATAIVGAAAIRGVDLAGVVSILVPGTFGVLAMATFFALLIRPRAQQIAALRRREERDGDVESVRRVRDARVGRLHSQVRPLLEYIAAGEPLSDEDVARCRLVEAGLRDRIRAPGLDVAAISTAAWEARARGVRVVLLDDRDAPCWGGETVVLEELRAAAVGALDGAQVGAQVTVRLVPAGRSLVGTIAIAEDGQVRRTEFTADDSTPTPPSGAGP